MILRTESPEEIQKLYNRLNNDTKIILENIVKMTYFMRVAISYDHALYGMSYVERDIVLDHVQKRLETESKSPHPVY